MEAFCLITIILGISGQNILRKAFSEKLCGKGIYTFTTLTLLSSMAFFLITSRNFHWDVKLIPYALFFALSYGSAAIFTNLALSHGPLSLTALINSFSLMIPTFYGLLFLKEPVSFGLIPGLVLLACALLLINKNSKDSPFTFKWLLYILIAFAGNGFCSVAQKMQQIAFAGDFKNEFMILSLSIVSVIVAAASLVGDRKNMLVCAKGGWYLAAACGVLNGMVNLFVMILHGLMSTSLIFPMISVGGIIITFLASRFIYKEKLSTAQYVGFLSGTAAIVFLNLN